MMADTVSTVDIPQRIVVIMTHHITDTVRLIPIITVHHITDRRITDHFTGEVVDEVVGEDVEDVDVVVDFMDSVIRTAHRMVHHGHTMAHPVIPDLCFLDLDAVKMDSWNTVLMES